MAIITFSIASPFSTTRFPTAALRELLTTNLSGYKWQCGEQDGGAKGEVGSFHAHMLISGRSFDTVVFTELRAVDAVMPGAAPAHMWHLNVGAPTTEIQDVADRITAIICTTLMSVDTLDCRCQLHPGGTWLTAEGVQGVLARVISGELLSLITGFTAPSPASQPSDPEPAVPPTPRPAPYEPSTIASSAPLATPPHRPGGFGRKGL
ncbi:MAG: hypothetical protein ABI240_02715 [Sphingomonas sp.]